MLSTFGPPSSTPSTKAILGGEKIHLWREQRTQRKFQTLVKDLAPSSDSEENHKKTVDALKELKKKMSKRFSCAVSLLLPKEVGETYGLKMTGDHTLALPKFLLSHKIVSDLENVIVHG